MSKYKITNCKGSAWGEITSHVELKPECSKVLGPGLDVAIYGMQAIETQLLAEMATASTASVRSLLYLYFNLSRTAPKATADEVIGAVISALRTTRAGLEAALGTLDIRQNEAGTSDVLNGYVRSEGFFGGGRGPIHLNFPKIMNHDLRMGAVYWSGLIVHEATHKYALTTDLSGEVVVPNEPKKDGYLAGDHTDTLARFNGLLATRDQAGAREGVVGAKITHITTAQHLVNADSYTWFFIAMLQAHEAALPMARRFSGMFRDLQLAVGHFAVAQRAAVPPLMLTTPGYVKIDDLT